MLVILIFWEWSRRVRRAGRLLKYLLFRICRLFLTKSLSKYIYMKYHYHIFTFQNWLPNWNSSISYQFIHVLFQKHGWNLQIIHSFYTIPISTIFTCKNLLLCFFPSLMTLKYDTYTYKCRILGIFPNTPSAMVDNSLSCNSLEKKNKFISINISFLNFKIKYIVYMKTKIIC